MNQFLKYIIPLSLVIILFSCNNDFIDEKIDISGVATSAIIISPEWESDNYQFQCEGTGNDDFVIESKPDWMQVENMSGTFVNNIATIRIKANAYPQYSQTGIYIEQMVITTGSKKYAVPVYYITEGSPVIKTNQNLKIAYNNYNNQLQITNEGDGILLWDIISMPEWLSVDMDQFSISSVMLGKDATAIVPFTLNTEAVTQNSLDGSVLLITNDKNNPTVEISVSADLGTPNISFFDEYIDFGTSETTKTFNIYTYGDGILIWNFEQFPDWLTISSMNGITMPYSSSGEVIFTCDRSKLEVGLNTANITLKTNDPNTPIINIVVTARVPGISENIQPIEGNIIDVVIQKNTNTLYYITSQPNKLIAYNIVDRNIVGEVALSKAPTCVAFSEDFKKALIGHGGMISVLNLSDFSVTKTYETNYAVYSAEWAKEDWFCYTKANSTTTNLFWINTVSDETYETPSESRHLGTADLKKVPGQPYIIGSRPDISPTGIFVFDIDTKTMKSYVHKSIGKLWFFDEGELVITQYSEIMRTSVLTSGSSNPSAIGELKTGEYAQTSWWLDFSPANHSIWAIFSYYSHSYYPPESATIYQFEDNDYTLVKKYTYDNIFQPSSTTSAYEVEARYVFSNSEGTELSILRKGKNNNNWSIEFIPVIP